MISLWLEILKPFLKQNLTFRKGKAALKALRTENIKLNAKKTLQRKLLNFFHWSSLILKFLPFEDVAAVKRLCGMVQYPCKISQFGWWFRTYSTTDSKKCGMEME